MHYIADSFQETDEAKKQKTESANGDKEETKEESNGDKENNGEKEEASETPSE